MANPIDPFQSERIVSGVPETALENIIAEMVLEEDAGAVMVITQEMTDSDETLADSDLLLATFLTPRALTVTPLNTVMSGTLTVNGLDADGVVITEDFVFDSDAVIQGTEEFLSVTSVVVPAFTTDSDDTIGIGWDLPLVESGALVIPGGQANLQFYVKSSEVSAAGALDIIWYVSNDNVEWFELTLAPFDAQSIAEAAQPEQIAYGPGEVTAKYIKMELSATDDIDTTDNLTVEGWISLIPTSAQ